MKLRGGEFSIGTMGNFQPELTRKSIFSKRKRFAQFWKIGKIRTDERESFSAV